tara:strand:+ start:318 stop:674 length:357 start_codon:yes stop_codon:yes gene_type:complete
MVSIKRTTIDLTNIGIIIQEVVSKGGDKNVIIDKLSTLPRSTLIKALEEKDYPYYCKQALIEQDTKGNGVLVDIPKNIMNDIRKKKHFGYQQKVSKTKRDNARQTKTQSFLSELNKKK